MKKKFSNIVGPGNVSDNPLDLKAYSYCSSESEAQPTLVVWPQNTDQVRKIMIYANQAHLHLVIRGSGTSLVNGCVGENAVILSSEKINKIIRLDLKDKTVEVEAGARVQDLNAALKEFKVGFPLVPFVSVRTIGGMLALNSITKETQQLGRTEAWVEEIEFIDGTGKQYYTKKKKLLLGKEGLTGFITRAKLKVTEAPVLSFDIFKFTQLSELLKQARILTKDVELYFLEFFDRRISMELGFDNNYTLVVAYTSLKGRKKTVLEVREFLEKINKVHSLLRGKGYFYLQDPSVSLENTYDLIDWCEKNNVRLHGHIGLGLFYAYFLKEDKDLIDVFRSFLRRINGSLAKGFGYGLANKDFVNPANKKELIKLKDDYDYNNILNPGKVVNYR